MQKQFIILTILVLIASLSPSANAEVSDSMDCRSAVLEAYRSLKEKINPLVFSSTTFEELGITVEEFNNLSSAEQNEIYTRVKPIEVMVQETIIKINNYISRYVGSMYELYLADELETWRVSRDNLRSCHSF